MNIAFNLTYLVKHYLSTESLNVTFVLYKLTFSHGCRFGNC